MKNFKIFFTILLFVIALPGFSQKVKLKNGDVLIDEVVWLKYRDCGNFDKGCSLLDKNNEEIVYLNWITVSDEELITNGNARGKLTYVEVKFLKLKKSFEIQKTQKDIIKMLYNSKVINEDLTVNKEKVELMVEKYGKEFSIRY